MKNLLLIFVIFFSTLNAQNYSLSFDGVDDFVDCQSAGFNFAPTNLSQEAWVKLDTMDTRALKWHVIMSRRENRTGPDWVTLSVHDGYALFGYDGDHFWNGITGTTLITDDVWHHIAGTKNGNTLSLYVDGNLEGIYTGVHPFGSNERMSLGRSGAWENDEGALLQGHMTEVRTWNKALTQSEINNRMYSKLNGDEDGLVGYWNFSDGSNTILTDLSGNNNHGTIYGAIWSTDVPPSFLIIDVSIDSITAFIGDTVSIPVMAEFPIDSTFSSAEISFGGFQQSGLEFIGVESDTGLMGTAGWTIQTNETNPLLITASAGATDISGGGELFRLQFYIPKNLTDGSTQITVENALFNNGELAVLTNNGSIDWICPVFYGDVDQNGEVRAFDASQILKYLVEQITLSPCQQKNADVTIDETVSALDASVILMNVVGLIDTLPYDTTFIGKGIISMNDGEIQPGATISIPLNLSSGENILSFEGEIQYNPQHLSFSQIVWSEELTQFIKEIGSVDGRILFSGAGSLPDGAEGIFGNIQFIVNEDFNEGETSVQLSKLQWNEEELQENVSNAVLSVVTTLNKENDLPTRFSLNQNYPNPFNPVTTIKYQLSKPSFVNLTIYNMVGEKITTLVSEKQAIGTYKAVWNASGFSSGVYLYRLETDQGFVQIKKLILLK